jgi:LysM repeat protein
VAFDATCSQNLLTIKNLMKNDNLLKSNPKKVCPNCGAPISGNAKRCLVCGKAFAEEELPKDQTVKSTKLPEMTLSLPVALGLMVLLLVIGAGVVFALLKTGDRIVEPTAVPTASQTPTMTVTPTATMTATPQPTNTPLPPLEYTIKQGDSCLLIAATFDVSIQSIVLLNDLAADCGVLSVGQKLLIPQPTPTPTAMPTSTLSAAEATEAACEKYAYTVGANDTLSGIAQSFNISMDAIREYNGLTGDVVWQGQVLNIPLCERYPTPGPTATATLPPPYPAPNLLLPADGAAFTSANDTVTLQWASVGTLRTNEAYMVTIVDITEGMGRKVEEVVNDTKFIVPASFRPTDETPHVIRWSIMPVRQTGTTKDGEAIWDSAGTRSQERAFSWSGTVGATPVP